MTDYQLGQPVRFTRPLTRRSVYPPRSVEVQSMWGNKPHTSTLQVNKEWQPNQFAEPQLGIIVGKRTLANGYCHYEEWGSVHDAVEHFTAYLIAYDLRRKPVLVRPEHIEESS